MPNISIEYLKETIPLLSEQIKGLENMDRMEVAIGSAAKAEKIRSKITYRRGLLNEATEALKRLKGEAQPGFLLTESEQQVRDFIREHSTLHTDRDHKVLNFEPGNGTRYVVFAQAIHGLWLQSLGGINGDGWMVINGLTGRVHLFQDDGMIDAEYVGEKLWERTGRMFPVDVAAVTAVIGYLTGRPTTVTDTRQFGAKQEEEQIER